MKPHRKIKIVNPDKMNFHYLSKLILEFEVYLANALHLSCKNTCFLK